MNFGVLYGMSAFGLAERLGIDRKEAEKFIDQYFARYPKVQVYQDNLLKKARQDGYVASILRPAAKVRAVGDPPEHQLPRPQPGRARSDQHGDPGSAADLIKLAMLNVHRRLKAEKRQAKMLLSVHDELVFEAPPKEVPAVAKLVREEMVGAMTLEVPLEVEVSAGKNWLEVEEVKA